MTVSQNPLGAFHCVTWCFVVSTFKVCIRWVQNFVKFLNRPCARDGAAKNLNLPRSGVFQFCPLESCPKQKNSLAYSMKSNSFNLTLIFGSLLAQRKCYISLIGYSWSFVAKNKLKDKIILQIREKLT